MTIATPQGNGNEGNYVNPLLEQIAFANARSPITGNNFNTKFNASVPADIQAKYPGIVNRYRWDNIPVGAPVYDPMTGQVFSKPPPKNNSFGSVLSGMVKDAPNMAGSWVKDFGPVLAAAALGGMFPPAGAGADIGSSVAGAGLTDVTTGMPTLADLGMPALNTAGGGIGSSVAGLGLTDVASGMPTLADLGTPSLGTGAAGTGGLTLASAGGPGSAPVYDATPTLTGNAAPSGGVLGAAKDLGGALFSNGGAGGMNGLSTGANLVQGLAGLYGASQQGNIADQLKNEAGKLDPFGTQRPFYQNLLQQSYTDPFSAPEFNKLGAIYGQQISRQMANKGLTGNPLQASAALQDQMALHLNDYRSSLMNPSGASIAPGGGSLYNQAANYNNSSTAQLTGGLASLYNGVSKFF